MNNGPVGDFGDFRSALWALLGAVVRRYPGPAVSVREGMVPRFPTPDRINWERVVVFDASYLTGLVVHEWAEGAGSWTEFNDLLALVEANTDLRAAYLTDAAGQPLGNPPAQHRWWLAYSIRNFLYDYFGAAGPRAWPGDEGSFERLFAVTATSIRSRKRRVVYWAPLYNCQFADPIDPQPFDGVAIEEPAAADLAAFAGPLISEPISLISRFPSHFLRVDSEEDMNAPEFGGVDLTALKRCATAIRLVQGGNARVREIFVRPVPGYLRGLGQPGYLMTSYAESHWQRTEVRRDGLTDIAEAWKGLASVELNFPVPLRRYILTSDRMEAEDRLIDAAIGLEGLLLSDRPSETAAIFALRGAWLLGATPGERAEWQRKLTTIYDVRSRVVHANAKALAKRPEQVAEAGALAVEILGRFLRRLAGEGHDAKAWEALVASGPLG